MFFDNHGNDVASSHPKFVYFNWFYNSASGTARSYNAPANNAKYSVSKQFSIPYVFEQIRCVQPKSMSQIVKQQLVSIALLKCIRVYNIEHDSFSCVLITFGEIFGIRWFSNCWYFLCNIDTFESGQHRNIANVVIYMVRSNNILHDDLAANTRQRRQGSPLLYNSPLESLLASNCKGTIKDVNASREHNTRTPTTN